MDLLQRLRIFLRVADSGGFARAAEQLGIAASSATLQVQKLEQDLGTQLFLRTTRSVHLTPDGEQLYERALRLVSDAEETRSLFRQSGHQVRGRLRVEAPARMVRRLFAPNLPDLLDAHPGLELELNSSDRLSDLVEAGIDCVIRVGIYIDPSMIVRPLAQFRQVTCASPVLIERLGMPTTPNELAAFPAIHYGGLHSARREYWELHADGKLLEVPMQGRVSVNNTESYVACAITGMGAIQAPFYDLRDELASGRLIEILPATPPPPMPVQLLYPPQRRLSQRLRIFMRWVEPLLQAQ